MEVGKLSVNIAEFILPAFRQRKIGRQFLEITFIKWAVVVDALVFSEMFPVFDRLEGMVVVRVLEF